MDRLLHIDLRKTPTEIVSKVVGIIRNGGVIVYPTDTVYGLGADALNPIAVMKIFRIKHRSVTQPLPLAVSNLNMTQRLAFLNKEATRLTQIFWPGALTIVLEKKPIVSSIVAGGGKSVGLRMPNHVVPLLLLQMSDRPLISTSANKHGMPSPTEARDAMQQIGNEVDLILDCGRVGGQPSTIIDLSKTPPKIVRKGPITREMIEKVIGHVED